MSSSSNLGLYIFAAASAAWISLDLLRGGNNADGSSPTEPLAPSSATKKKKKKEVLPGVPVVGADSELVDYIGGLRAMCGRIDDRSGGGKGVYTTWDGGFNLVLTEPNFVEKTLCSIVDHNLAGLKPASEAFFGKKVLFVLEGQEWRSLRLLMKKAFDKGQIALMQNETSKVARQVAVSLDAFERDGEAFDVLSAVSAFHLSAVGKASMGFDFGCVEFYEKTRGKGTNAINRAFELMLTELPRRAFSPDPAVRDDYETDNEDNRKYNGAAKAVRAEVEAAVRARLQEEARRGGGAGGRAKDLLQGMIEAYREEEGGEHDLTAARLTDEIGDNLVEILFAGYNTATNVVANGMYFLAKHQDWQRRCQSEIDAVLGRSGLPNENTVMALPLLRRVVRESLRLVPPAAVIARRYLGPSKTGRGKDRLALGGTSLPDKTDITIPAFWLHTDPKSWGADAKEFNPDRFLPERFAKIPRGAYIPFSDGARSCIGRHYAEMESITALAMLLQRHSYYLAPGYDWDTIFTGFGLRPVDKSTGKIGVMLVAKRRR